MAINKKSLAIAAAFVLSCFSCAHLGKNPADIPPGGEKVGITVVSFDEADVRYPPGEENIGGPSFVSKKFPNPFSTILCYCFYLPVAAHTRIELCNDEGKVVSKLIDERMHKGAYELTVGRPYTFGAGKYTLRLLVDKKLAGTRKFTILK